MCSFIYILVMLCLTSRYLPDLTERMVVTIFKQETFHDLITGDLRKVIILRDYKLFSNKTLVTDVDIGKGKKRDGRILYRVEFEWRGGTSVTMSFFPLYRLYSDDRDVFGQRHNRKPTTVP